MICSLVVSSQHTQTLEWLGYPLQPSKQAGSSIINAICFLNIISILLCFLFLAKFHLYTFSRKSLMGVPVLTTKMPLAIVGQAEICWSAQMHKNFTRTCHSPKSMCVWCHEKVYETVAITSYAIVYNNSVKFLEMLVLAIIYYLLRVRTASLKLHYCATVHILLTSLFNKCSC